jgi:hypothetical protein
MNGFAFDVNGANGRDDLIEVFARYKVVPKKNPMSGSGMAKSDYILERRGEEKPGGNSHAVGTETMKKLIKRLGIDSDSSCERVREEIKNHPRWGASV